MKKVSVFYFLALVCGLQACNPEPSPSTLSSTTLRPRPITVSPTPVPISPLEQLTSTIVEQTASTPLSEEYSSNCHTNNENSEGDSEGNSTKHAYQHIVVSGLPFQRGESHGLHAREKIQRVLSFYKSAPFMPAWGDCVNFVRANYMKALQQYYPNGLEEMKGIAKGAGVTLEDVLILNSRYELIRWKHSQRPQNSASHQLKKAKASSEMPECIRKEFDTFQSSPPTTETSVTTTMPPDDNNIYDDYVVSDECTGVVALSSSTKYAHVLLGQNWDANDFVLHNDTAILLEVHPDACENIKPFVILAEAGQLGGIGMNADGLGVVAMSLSSSSDTFERSTGRGWIPSSLLRRMYLESPNFSSGLHAMLRAPIHVSLNMIIATADDEALNIELSPNRYFTSQMPLKKEFFAHSNHFKSSYFISQNDILDLSKGESSLFRDRRVEKHMMNAWPRITEETFQSAFRDHVGHPSSVCTHSIHTDTTWASKFSSKATVASIIFNLSQRTLQISKGPPCLTAYKTYCFDFSQL